MKWPNFKFEFEWAHFKNEAKILYVVDGFSPHFVKSNTRDCIEIVDDEKIVGQMYPHAQHIVPKSEQLLGWLTAEIGGKY